MSRAELPPDLSPAEQRIAIAAIEHLLSLEKPRLDGWRLAARAEDLRIGGLHLRHQTDRSYHFGHDIPFAPGGTRPQIGRGDSR